MRFERAQRSLGGRRGERLRSALEEILRGRFEVVTRGAEPVFHFSFMSRPARN
jgi:hypothetical protein